MGEMGAELTSRIHKYCDYADGVIASLEEHPQPRRLARYLLENVDYEILEQPLSSGLLAGPSEPVAKDSPGLIAGFPRHYVFAAALVIVLIVLLLVFFFMQAGPDSGGLEEPVQHIRK